MSRISSGDHDQSSALAEIDRYLSTRSPGGNIWAQIIVFASSKLDQPHSITTKPPDQGNVCTSCAVSAQQAIVTKKAFLRVTKEVVNVAQLAQCQPWIVQSAVTALRRRVIRTAQELLCFYDKAGRMITQYHSTPLLKTRAASSTDSNDNDSVGQLRDPSPAEFRPEKRLSVSAAQIDYYLLPRYLKTDDEIRQLRTSLGGSFVFESIRQDPIKTAQLIDALKPMSVIGGTWIIREGDTGDGMYFVQEGIVELIRMDTEKVIKRVGPHDIFGELAVLYNSDRSYSARALNNCRLWFLDKYSYNAIIRGTSRDI